MGRKRARKSSRGPTADAPASNSHAAAPSSVKPLVFDEGFRWETDPPIPKTHKSAMNSPYRSFWIRAIDRHVSVLNKLQVWTHVSQTPKKATLLQGYWSFDSRKVVNSQFFDAQLMVRDSGPAPKLNLKRKSVKSVSVETVRFMLALAVQHDWLVERLEVDAALSYGTMNRPVYVRLPDGVPNATRFVYLNRTISGLREAPLMWYNAFCDFVEKLGFRAINNTPGLFFNVQGNVRTFILLFVDDILIFSGTQNQMNSIKSQLNASLHIIEHGFPKSYLSLGITRLRDGSILVDSTASVKKTLDKYAHLFRDRYDFSTLVPVSPSDMARAVRIEKARGGLNAQDTADAQLLSGDSLAMFRSAVGSLGSLVNKSRPDIAFATSYFSSVMNGPNSLHWRMLMRLLCYLDYHYDATLHYRKQNNAELVCYACEETNSKNVRNGHSSAVWAYGDSTSPNDNKIHWQSWSVNHNTDPYNAILAASQVALKHADYLNDLLVAIQEKRPRQGGVFYADLDMFPQLSNNRSVTKTVQGRGMDLISLSADYNPAAELCSPWDDDFDSDKRILEYNFG